MSTEITRYSRRECVFNEPLPLRIHHTMSLGLCAKQLRVRSSLVRARLLLKRSMALNSTCFWTHYRCSLYSRSFSTTRTWMGERSARWFSDSEPRWSSRDVLAVL